MKYFLISDNVDTLTGLRLAGVEGVVVHSSEEVSKALNDAFARSDIGLIMITGLLVEQNRDLVFDYKLNRKSPLIVEIPDRHHGNEAGEAIKRYIYEVVGIKV